MKIMRNTGFSWKTLSPGKRSFLVFGLAVFISGAILLFIPLKKEKSGLPFPSPKTKEEFVQNLNHDTDQDGLKDWEEKIYGTDPKNADTDGDGAPDGQEIKESRNPLKPGPNDVLTVPLPQPEDENQTQMLANELIGRSLTQVIAENVAGGPMESVPGDPTYLQSYVDKLSERRLLEKVIPPQSEEFKITTNNSPDAVKKYFNAVIKIHIDNFSLIDSDISILYLASTGNNPKAFRRLDANVEAIEKAIRETKEVPVPSEWTWFAKNYVWYLSKTLTAVKILKNSENDPVSSLLILNDRIQLIDDFRNLYLEAKTKFAAGGIFFGSDEPAAALINQR